jgi:putative ABC transport system substrate-binding protein
MRRREFLGVVGGAAASAWPLRTNAQPAAMPVIGYFSSRSSKAEAPVLPAFRKGLAEAGYVIGQNAAIEFRHSDGQDDRLPALAADLVRRNVSVLVATDRPSALAAAAATTTLPVVFLTGRDPVGQGLAASFNRPDRNLTGINVFTVELGPKRLELLREMVPNAAEIAFIVNPQEWRRRLSGQRAFGRRRSFAAKDRGLERGRRTRCERRVRNHRPAQGRRRAL